MTFLLAVHTCTPTAIQPAIRAGVKAIEHGQLLDEEKVFATRQAAFANPLH